MRVKDEIIQKLKESYDFIQEEIRDNDNGEGYLEELWSDTFAIKRLIKFLED